MRFFSRLAWRTAGLGPGPSPVKSGSVAAPVALVKGTPSRAHTSSYIPPQRVSRIGAANLAAQPSNQPGPVTRPARRTTAALPARTSSGQQRGLVHGSHVVRAQTVPGPGRTCCVCLRAVQVRLMDLPSDPLYACSWGGPNTRSARELQHQACPFPGPDRPTSKVQTGRSRSRSV